MDAPAVELGEQSDGAIIRNGVATDITAEKQLEAKLLEAAQRNSFRLELADAIKPLTDPFEIIAVVGERLGKKLGCHQVVYSEIDAKQEYAVIKRESTDGSMPTSVGVHRPADYGRALFDEQLAGKVTAIDNVIAEPRIDSEGATAKYLARQIGAFVRAPLVKNGKLVTVLGVYQREPRRWSAMDISLAEDVAERTWEAIERVRATEALRESEERLRFALRAANAGTWELDLATGKLVSSVDAWRLSGREPNGRDATYEQWLDTVHPDDRNATARSVQEAIAAGREIAVEWRTCHRGDAQRWLVSRGGPMKSAAIATRRYVGVVLDITDRKRAEEKIGYLALHDPLSGLPKSGGLQRAPLRRDRGSR